MLICPLSSRQGHINVTASLLFSLNICHNSKRESKHFTLLLAQQFILFAAILIIREVLLFEKFAVTTCSYSIISKTSRIKSYLFFKKSGILSVAFFTGEKKTVTIRTGYEIIERTVDKYGQFLFPADIEVNTWWTNTGMTDEEVIQNYHAHGECEQFHSEIKTDMDVERLLSGKFETNELVLELTIIAYNILRMIGQETIGGHGPKLKHRVHRRRLRTVIGNMIMMASHITIHARQLVMELGRSNVWRHTFARVYSAFADFQL